MTFPMEKIKEQYKVLQCLLDNLEMSEMEKDLCINVLILDVNHRDKNDLLRAWGIRAKYNSEMMDEYKIIKYLLETKDKSQD